MPRMSKRDKLYWSFYLNDNGRIKYNDCCRKCRNDCKQSFRALIMECPIYHSKRCK